MKGRVEWLDFNGIVEILSQLLFDGLRRRENLNGLCDIDIRGGDPGGANGDSTVTTRCGQEEGVTAKVRLRTGRIREGDVDGG